MIDSFELLRDIYQVRQKNYRQKLDELVTLLHLEQLIRTPAGQLSLGQRMRCELAASLLHNPKILADRCQDGCGIRRGILCRRDHTASLSAG